MAAGLSPLFGMHERRCCDVTSTTTVPGAHPHVGRGLKDVHVVAAQVVNALPLPALDGGYMALLALEAARGKKLGEVS